MDQSICFLFVGIIILGVVLFVIVSRTQKRFSPADKEKYQTKYLEIENQLKPNQPATYQMAILNADKLVDQALRERRIKGKTMGERMKTAKSLFSDNNGLWSAHKLRNVIAHETNARITFEDAKKALSSFKKSLKDLGAI